MSLSARHKGTVNVLGSVDTVEEERRKQKVIKEIMFECYIGVMLQRLRASAVMINPLCFGTINSFKHLESEGSGSGERSRIWTTYVRWAPQPLSILGQRFSHSQAATNLWSTLSLWILISGDDVIGWTVPFTTWFAPSSPHVPEVKKVWCSC